MAEPVDKIGVVRHHRWVAADVQVERLKDRCRIVVSLGGGPARQIDRDGLVKLSRPGTVIELVHAFLLAEPRRKKLRGGLQADFRAALAQLEARGAKIVDLDGSVCSGKQRRALLSLVDSDLARSNRGAKSATNGAKSRGRPAYEPTEDEKTAAKLIWLDRRKYREWSDANKALRKQVNKRFTAWRAYGLWGGREPPAN
jgi:Asp-tRNA(Asn)/Glu-tRNA(Gln) amidotransferase A subunit family amidase